jgi:hypothetical protein
MTQNKTIAIVHSGSSNSQSFAPFNGHKDLAVNPLKINSNVCDNYF